MTVTVELEISYFNSEDLTFEELTVSKDFKTYLEAKASVPDMVKEEQLVAYDMGAQMDTFYWESFFVMDQDEAEKNHLL